MLFPLRLRPARAFDLELSFAPGNTTSPAGGVGDDPAVFTAVQEQLFPLRLRPARAFDLELSFAPGNTTSLGLRLVSTRATVDVVVVESVERPTVN